MRFSSDVLSARILMDRFLVLAFSAMVATSTTASTPVEINKIFLYQPNEVLERRVPDAAKLANYIARLQSVCQSFLAGDKAPETLDIVVAVRPGKRSRVWFVSSTRPADDPRRRSLQKKLEKVAPCELNGGPIAFAIVVKIAGGDGGNRKEPPMPKEWQDAADKGNLLIPDGILDIIWPSASAADERKAPPGFTMQVLEPTGGKIPRPKNWFYTESHDGPSYVWTLSREDPSKGPYTTGFRIQSLYGVKEGTGKSPKEFVLDYLSSKETEAKVLKTCGEQDQGMFTRVCIETEEGPHHILYSLFGATSSISLSFASLALRRSFGTPMQRFSIKWALLNSSI